MFQCILCSPQIVAYYRVERCHICSKLVKCRESRAYFTIFIICLSKEHLKHLKCFQNQLNKLLACPRGWINSALWNDNFKKYIYLLASWETDLAVWNKVNHRFKRNSRFPSWNLKWTDPWNFRTLLNTIHQINICAPGYLWCLQLKFEFTDII